MTAIDSIVKWALGKPPWFADAVRRHLSSNEDELPEKDFQEILAIAEANLGLTDQAPASAPMMPTPEMFSGMQTPTAKVALEAVQAVANVNAIKTGQAINFAETGLTVIYGSNGAGKSGFTRILKNACRARDKERVLPNVFSNASAVPSATIKLQVNGVPAPFSWKQGENPDPLLSQVTVFDARCARVIIDDQNAPTYLPYGADVFPRVAQTAKRVRAAIQAKVVKVEPLQDSAVAANSSAAAFLSNLNHTTTEQALELATSWQPADEQALKDTEGLIRTSESDNMPPSW